VFAVDREGGLVRWNAAAERLWGRRPLVGERLSPEGWRWSDGRPIGEGEGPLSAVLAGGEARPTELLSVRPDGRTVLHLLHLRPLPDEGGRLAEVVALLVEIAERTQDDLDRERLAAIVSSSNDAIIGKTLDGLVASWNEGATRMYGYTAEEMMGRSVTLLMPDEIRDEEDQILARLRRGERIEHFDTVRVTKDGRRIDVSIAISPVRDGSGRIVGASKVARDITERKRNEELQRLLLHELNHRVKNTLATIQAIASQSLRRAPDPASFVASFSGRVQALARAHDLLVKGEFRGTGVADLVREQVLLGPGEPRVRTVGPDVRLDARATVQLALVLHELATNARKYGALARPEGRLLIDWRVTGDAERRLVLSWRESGVPGVRAQEGMGQGFGTTLINRSLETAGGSARLTYGPDGLACTLELPLGDDGPATLVPAPEPAWAVTAPRAQPPAELGGRRVLVVEDEPFIAMDVEASLTAAGCIVVGPAPSVERALVLIGNEALDAAVLDANLGGRSVESVADALAARGVPFVFATGYGREALPAAHGAAPVLGKPVAPVRLVAAIAALVSARND
jgi:PAS domain S-box-containing protein